jgi:hypothetical protein
MCCAVLQLRVVADEIDGTRKAAPEEEEAYTAHRLAA